MIGRKGIWNEFWNEEWSRQFYIHKSVNTSWLVTTTKTRSYYFNFSTILKTDLGISHALICEVCVCQCVGHISNTLPHNDVCLVLLSLLAHLSYCNIIAGCSIKIVKVKYIIVIVSISKPSFQWMKYFCGNKFLRILGKDEHCYNI